MNKPNTLESLTPLSGAYSFKKDMRLNAWLLVALLVYLAVLTVDKRHPDWTPLTRALFTLAPLLPGMLYVRDCLRFIRGMDELQRRIQTDAWLFAALWALLISTVLHTLKTSGVDLGILKNGLSLWGTGTLTFFLWLIGIVIANCRYK